MLSSLNRNSFFVCRELGRTFVKRFFLSNAYKCTEEWENRLKAPAFEKIDIHNLYHHLDYAFSRKRPISVLDIDLFVNKLDHPRLRNELEDVLYNLRLNPECILLPERTTHAVVRYYMDHCSKEDLLNILGDRLNYGVFPDNHLTNLLLNQFLTNKDSVSAVKIAALQMLQEDFDNPILKVMSLYACYNYLASPDIWAIVKEPEPDEDEEVEKIRVKFLRNPYFDDHFDIKDPNHLVGKTLWMLGLKFEGALGASSQLVGLVMYEKFDKCEEFLENLIKNKTQIHTEAVTKAKEFVMKKPKQVAEDEKSESQPELDEPRQKVLKLLDQIDEKSLVSGDLLAECEKLVKEAVDKHEKENIEVQCQMYKNWEKERNQHIEEEIKENELEKLKLEIEKTKQELEKEEEKLFFFENEEELLVIARQKEEEKQSVVFYKPKGKEVVAEDYIPPDVTQKKN